MLVFGSRAVSVLAMLAISSSMAEVPEHSRAAIDRIIGLKGTYAADEGVYKVVLPEKESTVVLDYQSSPPISG